MTRSPCILLLIFVCTYGAVLSGVDAVYYGVSLGKLSELHHAVRGEVYAVDSRTLYLRDFHYDGEGPAAYFYVGTSDSVTVRRGSAWRVRDEAGGESPLRRYNGEHLALALPDGKTLADVRWFAIWCDDFSVNFGSVAIPQGLAYPRAARLGSLSGVHGVSSDPVLVVDAQTLLLPNFSYDGGAPDAKFWVGRGPTPSPRGVRVPDESGSDAPLRRYQRTTVVLTLPGDLTVFDIGHFGVWCEQFAVDFGHVRLSPEVVRNVPPSLRMLGVNPQSKLNCEVLSEELSLEVRWAVAGDSLVIQLVGKIEEGEYMSFGVSGVDGKSQMVGGDVAVTWLDANLTGHADDYFLDAKSQCAGVRGVCPDRRLAAGTSSLRLLSAAKADGYSVVTYRRALAAADSLDRSITPQVDQAIIWAVGPLNSQREASYHTHYNKEDKFLRFGRPPKWNCPLPESSSTPSPPTIPSTLAPTSPAEVNTGAWDIPPIQCHEPADGVFYVQTGPTGGKRGYSAITGHVGWGLSWYINGLLAPELYLVRGRRYTFVVEGGDDPEVPARYHPFYITDDPIGGYQHKSDRERQSVHIYAGVRPTRAGPSPTGVGRRCHWTPGPDAPPADDHPSFGAYQRSLRLECDPGNAGIVTWTPDANTPDTVYYQCYTHRHLGWKIHIVDACDVDDNDPEVVDPVPQESQQVLMSLPPPPPPSPQHPGQPGVGNSQPPFQHPGLAGVVNSPPPLQHSSLSGVVNSPPPRPAPHHSGLSGVVNPPPPAAPQQQPDGRNRPSTLQAALRPHNGNTRPHHGYRFRPPHTKSPYPPQKPNYYMKKPLKPFPVRRPPLNPMMPPGIGPKPNFLGPPKSVPKNNGANRPTVPNAPLPETTLNLGQMDIIGTRVVQSHITLPERMVGQHSDPPPSFVPPEQIILGKPMEYPVPLDQQMIPTGTHMSRMPPSLNTKSDIVAYKPPIQTTVVSEQQSFMNDAPPAENTGFKPESIVIESGFKPIIREPLMDRTADRREDTDHREDADADTEYEDEPQHIHHAYPIGETVPQSFEPMFVPSPPDTISQAELKTEEVFPKNHAKEDRPHPVYVPPEKTGLFSTQNLAKDPSPMMAPSSTHAHYLPPDPQDRPQKVTAEEQTFTTYDGKTVSASTLTETDANVTEPFSARLPTNSKLLLKTPQFGPFKGDIPSDLSEVHDKLLQTEDDKLKDTRTTLLKPVNSVRESEPDELDTLKAEGSLQRATFTRPKWKPKVMLRKAGMPMMSTRMMMTMGEGENKTVASVNFKPVMHS